LTNFWTAAYDRRMGKIINLYEAKSQLSALVEEAAAGEEIVIAELPLTVAHVEQFEVLPRLHDDPFDRMLVAQARAEVVTLVTHDRQFDGYDVPVLWV